MGYVQRMLEEFGTHTGNFCKVKDQCFYSGQELTWLQTSVPFCKKLSAQY